MLLYALGTMGTGKTLFATNYAVDYQKRNPNNNIFANYNLKLKNFHFTPFMFLPFTKLNNCLLICDDFYALQNLQAFTSIICNLSRKMNLDIILTAQYYTMIPPKIRMLSNYEIRTKYIKSKDILLIAAKTLDGLIKPRMVKNAVKRAKNVYNTNEIVKMPSERVIIGEIERVSTNLDDLEFNLQLFSNNMRTRNRIQKEILERKNFNE